MESIESFCQNFVKCDQSGRIVAFQEGVDKREAVFVIQHVKVAQHILILHVSSAERHRLVEDRESITHRSVRLMGHHMKGFVVDGHSFA